MQDARNADTGDVTVYDTRGPLGWTAAARMRTQPSMQAALRRAGAALAIFTCSVRRQNIAYWRKPRVLRITICYCLLHVRICGDAKGPQHRCVCLVGARVKVAGLITTRDQPFSCLPKAATSLLRAAHLRAEDVYWGGGCKDGWKLRSGTVVVVVV